VLAIPEKIETERLILRRLRYEDAEEIFYTYASKPEATRYVSWPTHTSIENTRQFLEFAFAGWEEGSNYSFGIRLKSNNRLVGSCGCTHESGNLQFGYIFGPLHWGQGYATETATTLLTLLKSLPGVKRVGSFVDAENVASIRVLKKAGMEEEAVLERWFHFVNQGDTLKDCVLFKLP